MLNQLLNFIGVIKYGSPLKNKKCSQFEVDKHIISKFIVKTLIPIVGYSPYPLDELMLLVAVTCWYNPTHIFEWGTHYGKSARVFYETCTQFNLKTIIHSIDLPDDIYHEEHPNKRRGEFVKNIKHVKLYQGDGITSAMGLIRHLPRVSYQYRFLFFLDGDHRYSTVKKELMCIGKHLRQAAIIVHDTFYQSKQSHYNIGPYKAINEFIKSYPRYRVISSNSGLPGMTLLIPKSF